MHSAHSPRDQGLRTLRYSREVPGGIAAYSTGMGSSMDGDSARGATAVEGSPDWWPYAPEFPHWHVWRGVAGLLYARRPKSSPPKVVRGKDLKTLRERIIKAEVVH